MFCSLLDKQTHIKAAIRAQYPVILEARIWLICGQKKNKKKAVRLTSVSKSMEGWKDVYIGLYNKLRGEEKSIPACPVRASSSICLASQPASSV